MEWIMVFASVSLLEIPRFDVVVLTVSAHSESIAEKVKVLIEGIMEVPN